MQIVVQRIKNFIKYFLPEFMLIAFRNHKQKKLQRRLNIKIFPRKNIKFIGTEYSGYPVPLDLVTDNSICYCIGAGEEISFEQLLSTEQNCDVFLFDPTPRSISFIERLFENKHDVKKHYSSEESEYFSISCGRLNFLPFGIWENNDKVKMFAPKDETHVSHSIMNMQHTEDYFWAQCYTLDTMMEKLHHSHIDVLKLNVEGAEYAILYSMLKSNIKPKVLCVAFDEFHTKIDAKSDQRILDCLSKLAAEDYKAVYIDNSRMTFILGKYFSS